MTKAIRLYEIWRIAYIIKRKRKFSKKMALKDRYYISKITNSRAMDLVVKYHYLHRKAPCSFAFGLFEKNADNSGLFCLDKLVGVVCYGTPSSAPLRRGICGDSEKNNVIELTRLWIEDTTPKNAESFLIGNTIRKVNKEIVVSYAEISAGHIGTIYQATNFIYTGLSAKRTNWRIKGRETHGQTIADKYTSKQLKELIGDNFYLEDRPRKHRYVFINARKNKKKELIKKLKYNICPYPKKNAG
jgi:hypothetical protein